MPGGALCGLSFLMSLAYRIVKLFFIDLPAKFVATLTHVAKRPQVMERERISQPPALGVTGKTLQARHVSGDKDFLGTWVRHHVGFVTVRAKQRYTRSRRLCRKNA